MHLGQSDYIIISDMGYTCMVLLMQSLSYICSIKKSMLTPLKDLNIYTITVAPLPVGYSRQIKGYSF